MNLDIEEYQLNARKLMITDDPSQAGNIQEKMAKTENKVNQVADKFKGSFGEDGKFTPSKLYDARGIGHLEISDEYDLAIDENGNKKLISKKTGQATRMTKDDSGNTVWETEPNASTQGLDNDPNWAKMTNEDTGQVYYSKIQMMNPDGTVKKEFNPDGTAITVDQADKKALVLDIYGNRRRYNAESKNFDLYWDPSEQSARAVEDTNFLRNQPGNKGRKLEAKNVNPFTGQFNEFSVGQPSATAKGAVKSPGTEEFTSQWFGRTQHNMSEINPKASPKNITQATMGEKVVASTGASIAGTVGAAGRTAEKLMFPGYVAKKGVESLYNTKTGRDMRRKLAEMAKPIQQTAINPVVSDIKAGASALKRFIVRPKTRYVAPKFNPTPIQNSGYGKAIGSLGNVVFYRNPATNQYWKKTSSRGWVAVNKDAMKKSMSLSTWKWMK
jgi:hypothetical protein